MKEELIDQIASILEKWNPLGEKASSIPDLDGYRVEAIDILSTINIISGSNKVERAINQVLAQAFDLELDKSELSRIAMEVKNTIDETK